MMNNTNRTCHHPQRDLVYVATLKCASSFYYQNFTQLQGWHEIDYADINWRREHVFGHILEPVSRSIKAKIEYMITSQRLDLMQDPGVRELILETPWLDQHGVSYHDCYGDRCWQIDWIPLDIMLHDIISYHDTLLPSCSPEMQAWQHHSIAFTLSLITWYTNQQYQCTWDHDLSRPASRSMRDLYDRLLEQWRSIPRENTPAGQYLSDDLLLYDRVQQRFNPRGISWSEITWLNLR